MWRRNRTGGRTPREDLSKRTPKGKGSGNCILVSDVAEQSKRRGSESSKADERDR